MLTRLELTPANRPQLLPDETLLFVQSSIGLYEGKYKIPNYQNGFAYLTSHRACYVDNDDPRKYSVAVELKQVAGIEPYAGFLKSSPKISLQLQRPSPVSSNSATPRFSTSLIRAPSPPPITGVWICPICSYSNPIPSNYLPGITLTIPPCLTCGIAPSPQHLETSLSQQRFRQSVHPPPTSGSPDSDLACPRCTFHNHPSLPTCEICGESLRTVSLPPFSPQSSSPSSNNAPIQPTIIKFSFRSGGSNTFFTHLKSAMIQRKWLLTTAPPIPQPPARTSTPSATQRVGIAGLELSSQSRARQTTAVLSTAFEDLTSLKSAAKEVIALAESFSHLSGNTSGDAASQALGLVSKSQFTGSSAESAWIDELSRQVAEFLADDARGVLKREGGVMTLVDLWAVYNRVRGIDLISPQDLEKATRRFETLRLPVRTRRFKSGLVVVQDVGRKDVDTVRRVVEWIDSLGGGRWGVGVAPGMVAERFGWSLGVATEELEMAEERGALCREAGIEGVRFWRNWFLEDMKVQ